MPVIRVPFLRDLIGDSVGGFVSDVNPSATPSRLFLREDPEKGERFRLGARDHEIHERPFFLVHPILGEGAKLVERGVENENTVLLSSLGESRFYRVGPRRFEGENFRSILPSGGGDFLRSTAKSVILERRFSGTESF